MTRLTTNLITALALLWLAAWTAASAGVPL